MSAGELACTYASMILHDDGIAVTAEKIATLVKAFVRRGTLRIVMNVGSGGGAAVAVAAPAGASEWRRGRSGSRPRERRRITVTVLGC
ncbi:hypothetical protein DH2020_045717 [Rehmannia glutinosa]|uniref:Uncharacterized protein n=1 Tax=Rehmannia glutinosa TaxID=99300 RepID=A0ABR0UDX2_REHGL